MPVGAVAPFSVKTSLLTSSGALLLLFSQPLSRVRLFETPRVAARQASLSFTNSQCLLKLMSIESVMPSNRLILCCPLRLLLSIFPSIRITPRHILRRKLGSPADHLPPKGLESPNRPGAGRKTEGWRDVLSSSGVARPRQD